MSLHEKLSQFKAGFQKQVPPEVIALMNKDTEDLRNSGILKKVPKVGDNLPNFILSNQDGKNISLLDLQSRGPVIINFFRGAWCPYCNIELEALQENFPELEKFGASLVVISPQNHENALKTQKSKKLSFDVLVDANNSYAKKLNLVFSLSQPLQKVYSSFGINLPQSNGDSSWTLPMPARILVDEKGTVHYADISPDYTDRPEVEDVIQTLKTLMK